MRLKKIWRGRAHVHTRSVSEGLGELLHQKVKLDEVRESPIRFGNRRASEVLTQATQGSEVAKPVRLEFQQEGRGGIGDSKWIIVLGGAEKGNSGKWDKRERERPLCCFVSLYCY